MPKKSFTPATLALLLLIAPSLACSNDEDSSGGDTLHLTGTYDTAVSLISSNCAFPVQTNSTRVRATTSSITLTHAGTSYEGILHADSSFITQEKVVGGIYHISIAGDFTSAGLDAQVTVVWSNTPCTAVVHWVGPRT